MQREENDFQIEENDLQREENVGEKKATETVISGEGVTEKGNGIDTDHDVWDDTDGSDYTPSENIIITPL